MIIDNINLLDLPKAKEDAFVAFDKRLRKELISARQADRSEHTDGNGDYLGNYAPERYYVSSILAFMDEFEFDEDALVDISGLPSTDFLEEFQKFFTQINYLASRYALRKVKYEGGGVGTTIVLDASYKAEIASHLNTISKIVDSQIADQNKKDAIHKKIAALSLEVNLDRTTIDALFSRLLDFSKTAGECGENIEPLIDKLERIKKLIFDGAKKQDALPKPERRKQLPSPDRNSQSLEDDIPF